MDKIFKRLSGKKKGCFVILLLVFLAGSFLLLKRNENRDQTVETEKEAVEKSVEETWKETLKETESAKATEELSTESEDDREAAENKVEEPMLTVLISASDGSRIHTECCIQGTDELRVESEAGTVYFPADQSLDLVQYFSEKGLSSCTIYLKAEPQMTEITMDPTDEIIFPQLSGIQILTLEKAGEHPIYPGMLQIVKERSGEGLYILNHVSLESYLPRVVASEMPERFGLEALKSQAVCARSYALSRLLSPRYEAVETAAEMISWFLVDTTSDQVYNASPLDSLTILACQETEGEILWDEASQNVVIPNYYSTSWGERADELVFQKGVVEAAAMPWKGQTAESEADNREFKKAYIAAMNQNTEFDSPWYRWISWIALDQIFEKPVNTLTVTKRGTGGYVSEMLVEYTDGNLERISGAGTVRNLLDTGINVYYLQDGSSRTGMQLLPSAFFYLDNIVTEGDSRYVTIHGGGFGHGYGMSQYGAAGLAKDGADYKKILSYYYDGNIQKMFYQ